MTLATANSVGLSLSLLDVVVVGVLVIVAVFTGFLSVRQRSGKFWKETAEERGARIEEFEQRIIPRLEQRITALEQRNHEQAVQIAQLEGRPDVAALFTSIQALVESFQAHDERAAKAFDHFEQQVADITALLRSTNLAIGALAPPPEPA